MRDLSSQKNLKITYQTSNRNGIRLINYIVIPVLRRLRKWPTEKKIT